MKKIQNKNSILKLETMKYLAEVFKHKKGILLIMGHIFGAFIGISVLVYSWFLLYGIY